MNNVDITFRDGSEIIAEKETSEGTKFAIVDESGNKINPFICDSLFEDPNLEI